MNAGIRLGKVFGAPVVADASAFVLALLFALVVLVDLRASGSSAGVSDSLIALVGGAAALGSIFAHEVSHALVAVRRGLNVRAIRLYLFGGYSVIDGSPSPATEILVSIAGPIGSAIVALLCFGLSTLVGADTAWGSMFYALALVNGAIALFNLLPGFPLDGGRALRGVLLAQGESHTQATRRVASVGQIVGYVAMGAGVVLVVRTGPIGFFVIAAGWYLVAAAATAGRREVLSASFDGKTMRDAMRKTPEAISGDSIVSAVLDLYAIGPRLRSLPVELKGRVVGVLGQEEIDTVAPARWASARVRTLMTAIGPQDVVDASVPLDELMLRPAGPSRRVVVVEDGVVVGIIEGGDLAQVLPTDEH